MRIPLAVGLIGMFSPVTAFQLPANASSDSRLALGIQVSRSQLKAAIGASANYLGRVCGPTGMFVYAINTASGRSSPSYNVVRHAGAIYALAAFNRSHPDRKTVEAMIRAATFLQMRYIRPDIRSNALAVWSQPMSAKAEAELGAAGLGLAALAEVHRVEPSAVQLVNLQSIGRFVISLQKADGSFYSKYRADSGPVGDWQSLYYPGEAALGLISLYELDHSHEWLVAAGRALSYLARSRANTRVLPPDHWVLIATAKFLPYYGVSASPASRAELIGHAVHIGSSFLPEQIMGRDPALDGTFEPTGRTTPTATRLEGMLAVLEFLPDDSTGLRRRIEIAVQRGIAFLLRAQITSGPYAGGMPAVMRSSASGVAEANPLTSEVRIDYVQHALSAWIRYQALLERESSSRH